MVDLKSEYRGRIKEKAEHQQRAAERERREAAEQSNLEKIVRSIDGVSEKLDRQTDENVPEKKSERRWHRAEVIGLWAAAAVGVIAICVASSDAEHQRTEMHGQLEAMKSQLAVMQTQTRPWMKGDFRVLSVSKDERGQLNLQFAQRMINIGNYPAPISFIGAVFMPDPGVKLAETERELCKTQGVSSWKNFLKGPVNVAFPNEWTHWEQGSAIVPPNLIADWQKDVLEGKNIKEGDPKPDWISRIPLVYVGCITYGAQATADAAIHQTGFVFYLPGRLTCRRAVQ